MINLSSPFWYEDVAQMSHAEVQAAMAAIKCACKSDDPHECTRIRTPHEVELASICGSETACPCTCHDIWDAWLHGDSEDES